MKPNPTCVSLLVLIHCVEFVRHIFLLHGLVLVRPARLEAWALAFVQKSVADIKACILLPLHEIRNSHADVPIKSYTQRGART